MAVYSYSRLSTFENCPFQYKCIYIDKEEREEESIEAFMGSRFHEAMEKLYKELNYKVHSLDELLDYYNGEWEKNYNDTIIIVNPERTADDYKRAGKSFIEKYYGRYYPFNQNRTLAVEKQVFLNLDKDGKYKIRGYIDRIDQARSGAYEIHDYKTSGTLPHQQRVDEDKQLALYQLAIQDMWVDVSDVKLIWHYVAFDKEMISTRTPEELEKVRQGTMELIDLVESAAEFLPKESALCQWCAYQRLCPKKKHFYLTETLAPKEFLKEDGVKLVNEYAALKDRESKIGANLEELKGFIIEYARQNNLDVVRGSNSKAKISETESVLLPKKDSLERKKLEEILRNLNKWEEFSCLDPYAVKKVVKKDSADKNLLAQITPLVTLKSEKQLRLLKMKDMEG